MGSVAEGGLLFLAALLGGGLNAIAGGGSFLTFPSLVLAGVDPLVANATSTVALWPGSLASALGYRNELKSGGSLVGRLVLVSAAGGLLGALGVLGTPQDVFRQVVPFLLLGAALVFTFGDRLRAGLGALGPPSPWVVLLAQLLIATYGGYFGGGMGFMMLALFSLMEARSVHAMNGLKSALGVAINLSALAVFIGAGRVDWPKAAVMTAGAIAGGYGVAAVARHLDARKVRAAVIVMAWTMTGIIFLRTFA